jgi:hypothetical protein
MHRTIKALRVGESDFNLKTSMIHFHVLFHLFRKYNDQHDRRLGFSLLGMKHVLESGLDNLGLTKSDYSSIFDNLKSLSSNEQNEMILSFFPSTSLGWIFLYVKSIGLKKIASTLIQIMRRKLIQGNK